MHIFSLVELTGQMLVPDLLESFSPLAEHHYLAVDLNQKINSDVTLLIKQLKQLPCPSIGICQQPTSQPETLVKAFDVMIEHADYATSLITNINNNPMAATTLVQLLRLNENLSAYDAVIAESLAYGTLQGGAEAKAFLDRRTPSALTTNSHQPVILSREEDKLVLTLNRPEQRNAYNIAMRDQLIEGLSLLSNDNSISKAIIRGAGDCFCIGGDLDEFGTAPDTATAHAVRSVRNAGLLLNELSDRIECHVHRACIGSGIELPAFTHRIIAAEDTFFQLPEITMGLIPGAGGTVSITRRIGRQRMAWWALSAKKINAKTALEWGLIDEIVQERAPGREYS